jgi:hypothetical protein
MHTSATTTTTGRTAPSAKPLPYDHSPGTRPRGEQHRPTKTSNFKRCEGEIRRDHVDAASFAGDLDHRCLPDWRPGRARVEVGPNPRFIAELHGSR